MASIPEMFRSNKNLLSDLGLKNSLGDLFREFEQFLSQKVGSSKGETSESGIDFHEDESRIFLLIDLPGVRKEDVKINLADNVLSITAERRHEYGEGDSKQSREFARFSRSFSLGADIDLTGIKAHHDHGVLEIILPKTRLTERRSIAIEAGRLEHEQIVNQGMSSGNQSETTVANNLSDSMNLAQSGNVLDASGAQAASLESGADHLDEVRMEDGGSEANSSEAATAASGADADSSNARDAIKKLALKAREASELTQPEKKNASSKKKGQNISVATKDKKITAGVRGGGKSEMKSKGKSHSKALSSSQKKKQRSMSQSRH